MAFRPYLFFGGDCAAAFTRYQEIFGGELSLMRAGDAPGEMEGVAPETVLHAAVVLPNGDYLMGSDDPLADPFGPVQGMMVAYDAADEADAQRVITALAEGGTITEALQPTFFSVAFGMVTDRFGTLWMVVGPEPTEDAAG